MDTTKLIELLMFLDKSNDNTTDTKSNINNTFLNKKVIIRTYSAGVHFGELIEKSGNEVILKNSRRLWYWETLNNGISLSEIANAGVKQVSKICSPVNLIWLEAIEIIPCTNESILNIENQDEYKS